MGVSHAHQSCDEANYIYKKTAVGGIASMHINEVYVIGGLGVAALLFCLYVGYDITYKHRPKRARELRQKFFRSSTDDQKLA